MKAHIFLIANLKFCLQTPCSFRDMAENVKFIGIPINNFLCIYIIASSPGLHTLFCLWRVNKKLPQCETSQNTFQRSRSISWKWKIYMVKWEHPPLRFILSVIRFKCHKMGHIQDLYPKPWPGIGNLSPIFHMTGIFTKKSYFMIFDCYHLKPIVYGTVPKNWQLVSNFSIRHFWG